MGEIQVVEFLIYLAVKRQVSPATQNQALNALVFLYKYVIRRPLGSLNGVVRARSKQRIPVVLTHQEVAAVLGGLQGVHWLVGCLLYGSGLRLMEAIRLRVKDLEFSHSAIIVRDGKGGKDRVVTLLDDPASPLR